VRCPEHIRRRAVFAVNRGYGAKLPRSHSHCGRIRAVM
jgi:hypothetical protein